MKITYIPSSLTKKDKRIQLINLNKSRKLYKKGVFFNRPHIKSFKSKKSHHITNALKLYNVKSLTPSKMLANKTQCTVETLKKIVQKGQGASYSSGSRPNQSAIAWGLARLGSFISGEYKR